MSGESGLRRQLPAGVFDSGFASLATFAVGLAAVNLFDDLDRGVYAVFFTAFVAGSLLSSEFVFTPSEVAAVGYPEDQRISLVWRTLALGLGPCLLGSAASLVAVLATSGYASPDVAFALAVTSAMAIVISPMQDHVRKMLHIASESWSAAAVSFVQVAVAVTAVLVGIALSTPVQWLPFGALAVANVVSLLVGLGLVRIRTTRLAESPLLFMPLARRGVWFVLNAAAPALSGFAAAALVAWLASPEDLGYAESARVVAQPIFVVGVGLKAVLHPRSIRAAMDVERSDARRTNRLFVVVMVAITVAYLALVGWDWTLNPMAYIVPSAYILGGLVALTIVANAANSMWFLLTSELAGARRERSLAGISWIASTVSVLLAATAGVTGAYARALGSLVSAIVRYGMQRRSLDAYYEGHRSPRDLDVQGGAPTRDDRR